MYMCDIQCFVTHFKVSHFNFYCVFYLDINKQIPIWSMCKWHITIFYDLI